MVKKAISCMEASLGNVNLTMFKSWSPGDLGDKGDANYSIGICSENM